MFFKFFEKTITLKTLLYMLGAIAPILLNATPSQQEEIPPRQKKLLEIAANVRSFKQVIVDGNVKGFSIWFKPGALEKWNHLTRKMMINKENPGMVDFFEGSVMLCGSYNELQSVIALYNPWIDGILVLLLDCSGETSLVENFELISGETWRGEAIDNPLSILLPDKEPFSVPIWRNFARTEAIFNGKFPRDSDRINWQYLPIVNMVDELDIINTRIAFRFKLIPLFLDRKYSFFRKKAMELKTLMTAENPENFSEHFSPKQNKVALDTFFKIPYFVRRDMKLYSFIPGKDSVLLIFINPYLTRFAVSVRIDKKEKPTIEWYNLLDSGNLYKAWRK